MRLGETQNLDCGPYRPGQRSRSVSWNSNGSWLAYASIDRQAKISSVEEKGCREILTISGHQGMVDRVRFHPKEASILMTAAHDRSVRVWDVRTASQRSVGRIDLSAHQRFGLCPASVEWGTGGPLLVVTERNDTVHVYDYRKLNFGIRGGRALAPTPVLTFAQPNLLECCRLSPNGKFLVAASTKRGGGMGELRIWPWVEGKKQAEEPSDVYAYPGHTGPIYQFVFSPDGQRIATGGSDSMVGIWDTRNMICTHTLTQRTKFVRSVAFSHDSKLVASSSEEPGVDLARADNGVCIGTVQLGLSGDRRSGADEIAFHPSAYILASARGDVMMPQQLAPPVVVSRIKIDQ